MTRYSAIHGRLPWWTAWIALALSVAAYAAVGLLAHQPFHESARALGYFDLQIYRGAAQRVVTGVSLYGHPIHDGLGFTYPPFTALLMWPLGAASLSAAEVTVTAVNLLLLVWVMRLTLRLARRSEPGDGAALAGPAGGTVPAARAWAPAALLAAAAILAEPVSVTLGYGQINLLITALVIGDLVRPDRARTKGLGIGLAAALKLTPLVFIPYLLLTERRRAAIVATSVFAGSIALAYVALPADAARYWGGRLFLDPARVGSAADWANQSLRGAIARLSPHGTPAPGCEILIVAIALCGPALAVRSSRRGDEAAGFSLAALTALLASPISWTHHWTLAVPAVVLLGCRAHRDRSRGLWIVTAALAALGYAYAPEYAGTALPQSGLSTVLTSDLYVLAASVALATFAAGAASAAWAGRVRHTTARARNATTHPKPTTS